jgi:hypothetical protein
MPQPVTWAYVLPGEPSPRLSGIAPYQTPGSGAFSVLFVSAIVISRGPEAVQLSPFTILYSLFD